MAWVSNLYTMSRLVWMSKDLGSPIPGAIILDSARSRVQLTVLLVGGNQLSMENASNKKCVVNILDLDNMLIHANVTHLQDVQGKRGTYFCPWRELDIVRWPS